MQIKTLFVPDTFFDFSRRERRGIACLLSLIVMLHFLPPVWHHFRSEPAPADTTGFAAAKAAILHMEAEAAAERKKSRPYTPYKRKDSVYATRYKPYRYDSSRYRPGYRSTFSYQRKKQVMVHINTADSTQWEELPGIGPYLARKIVTFRERLGGFYAIKQVGETYGLADSVFKKIQPLLILDNVSLRKIDLNGTDEKSLAAHPYINTKLARTIIRYRSSHGPFREVKSLLGITLVDDSIYRKIENYLVVN